MELKGLDILPLWAVFLSTVVLCLSSVEGGFRFSLYRRKKQIEENGAAAAAMATSTLGLLALLLAFTFGIAANRFDDRRGALLDETNAIGTLYLRADLIEDPFKTNVKESLREYVQSRLALGTQPDLTKEVIASSEALLDNLWSQAATVGRKHPDSEVRALFIASVNQLIDLHSKRIMLRVRARLPEATWAALFAVTALSMFGLGYQSGINGNRNSPEAIILAITFSMILLLIAYLDRPWEGGFQVNPQVLQDLSRKLGPTEP